MDARSRRATYLLNREIERGKIERGCCEVCGRTSGERLGELIQGHHYDYGKPLEVIWLCAAHHKLLHLNLKRKGLSLSESRSILGSLTFSEKNLIKRPKWWKRARGLPV